MKTQFTLVVVVLAALLQLEAHAQSADAVIDAAAKAMGATGLQTIRFTATGTNNSVGQAYTSGGPWPRYTVTKYVAMVNFAIPAMRQEIVRVDDEYPPRGGGAGPYNPATGQGSIRPIPGDVIQNRTIDGREEVGALNLWLTPHGFLKGAVASGDATVSGSTRRKNRVSFTAFDKYTVTGTINEQNLVEHVETRIDVGFTGDTLIESDYSDYRDFGGVRFPMHIVQSQSGHPVLDISVADVEPNSPAAREISGVSERSGNAANRAVATAAAPGVRAEKIGEGVWFLNFANPQSLLVEFSDYVVIVEGPTNDQRTLLTIAEAKRMYPNKPIKYVVNTHHHSDHAGGLRAYVAEGIPIITHESHKRYYEQEIFENPHLLNPDLLARMPREPVIETVKGKRVITDGTMTLELHLARGNLHSEGLLMAYVPTLKLLIQADMFAPRPGAAPLPAPSPFTTNLVDNVERLKLDVQQVAHVHGGMDSWQTVLKAAGRDDVN